MSFSDHFKPKLSGEYATIADIAHTLSGKDDNPSVVQNILENAVLNGELESIDDIRYHIGKFQTTWEEYKKEMTYRGGCRIKIAELKRFLADVNFKVPNGVFNAEMDKDLNKPLDPRERESLLTVIIAILNMPKKNLNARGLAQEIKKESELNGMEISDDTILRILNQAKILKKSTG